MSVAARPVSSQNSPWSLPSLSSDSTYLPFAFPNPPPEFLFQWIGTIIHPSISFRTPNPKLRYPPSFSCQISHQVILVILLVTPKAVSFSQPLLFYFRPLYSLLKLLQKPLWKVFCDLPPAKPTRVFFCHSPLTKLGLQLNQTAYGLPQSGKCCKQVWYLVDQSPG